MEVKKVTGIPAFDNVIYYFNQALDYTNRTINESAAADLAHTEMREDTAYQRGVADMRAAGLNPYTIGSNPSPSSESSASQTNLTNRLTILGSVLDIANLSAKNRQITNNLITGVLNALGKFVG